MTPPPSRATLSPVSPGPGIHPRDTFRPTSSKAEQAVWSALRKHMPPGWYGWHSLRIRDRYAYEGEGDFILAHPDRGFLVLEVKGGQVEQRDGRWFQNGEPMPKAPLEQGTGFARKLSLRLRDANCAAPAYGAAVCFPDTYVGAQPSQDNLTGLVIGQGELPYLEDALPPMMTRAFPEARPAKGHWIEALHRLWGETWVPSLALGTRAKEALDRRLGLDPTQLEVLDGLLDNDRALVQGGAGSGKTLVAAEMARRLAGAGQKVLLLCFTAPLQKWLASRLDGSGVDVVTVSGLAKRLVDSSGGAPAAPVITGVEAWGDLFARASDHCRRDWDVVIVDEAQDLQFEAWVLVSNLAEGKRLFAFHDPGQGFWVDRKPPRDLFKAFYPLPRQLRGPPGVRALSDRILGKPFDAAALSAARADGTIGVVTRTEPDLGAGQDRCGGGPAPLGRARRRADRDRLATRPACRGHHSQPDAGRAPSDRPRRRPGHGDEPGRRHVPAVEGARAAGHHRRRPAGGGTGAARHPAQHRGDEGDGVREVRGDGGRREPCSSGRAGALTA